MRNHANILNVDYLWKRKKTFLQCKDTVIYNLIQHSNTLLTIILNISEHK